MSGCVSKTSLQASASTWEGSILQAFRGIFRTSDGYMSVSQALSLAEGSLCSKSQDTARGQASVKQLH